MIDSRRAPCVFDYQIHWDIEYICIEKFDLKKKLILSRKRNLSGYLHYVTSYIRIR